MTNISKLIGILTVSSFASITAKSVEPFIQAGTSLTYAKFEFLSGQTGWETGPMLAGGITFGAASEHSIGIETGWTQWSGTSPHGAIKIETTQIPVVLNYRYNQALGDNLSVFIGPDAGFIHQRLVETYPAFPQNNGTDERWKSTYGGTIGIKSTIGKNWSAQLAYQALAVGGDTIRTGSPGILTENPRYLRSSFLLSIGYAF